MSRQYVYVLAGISQFRTRAEVSEIAAIIHCLTNKNVPLDNSAALKPAVPLSVRKQRTAFHQIWQPVSGSDGTKSSI